MESGQETADCIIEILQDTKREDTEDLTVMLNTPTSTNPLAEVALHATDTTTVITILDDEGML